MTQNLRRLEAQRNELNAKGKLNTLTDPGYWLNFTDCVSGGGAENNIFSQIHYCGRDHYPGHGPVRLGPHSLNINTPHLHAHCASSSPAGGTPAATGARLTCW